uniref:Inter-alpha-trypsin inhibitor heavy chain C-terminal domain-containing protein n=1 Tax=Salvator merianae TaxID=96440 RepID=A0A8D0C0Y6_SALMN
TSTSGEMNTDVILSNVKNAIQGRYPLYNLGFGYDLDYGSLEKLAAENNGLARRIYEDSDSALQLQGFYDEVANPLLTEIELKYPENAISEVTQNNFKHYYDGSEIIVAGRLADNDINSITAEVKAHGVKSDVEETTKSVDDQYIFGDFIERLWAYLTIQQLLEKRNAAKGDEKANLTEQALEMSLKYKFVTPLTSMVVTKPEDNEDKKMRSWESIPPRRESGTRCSCRLIFLFAVDGDPHFIVDVPQKQDALCFNIYGDPGIVLNLITDPATGIIVNGQLIGEEKSSNNVQPHNTYIGKLGILNTQMNVKLEITPEKIVFHNGTKPMTFTWLDEVTLLNPSLILKITKKKSLEISMGEGAIFSVVLHKTWRKHAAHQDFLGFYTLDSHQFSENTHGLLGQFFHPIDFEILEIHPGLDPEKPDATMVGLAKRIHRRCETWYNYPLLVYSQQRGRSNKWHIH